MRQPNQITITNGRTLADVITDHRRWLRGEPGGSGADLRGADLRGADLRGAVLRGAVLRGAVLSRADLSRAVLRGADLHDADLRGAVLSRADLSRADLHGADLRAIEEDVRALVRDYATPEVLGLLRALYLGRVDGTTYSGECRCLVGTIAVARGCDVGDLPCDASRLAERWALGISAGDAAPHHPVASLTAEWILAELETRPDYAPGTFGAAPIPEVTLPEEAEAMALALLAKAGEMRATHV